MNEYEVMLLLDPELAEERANEIIQRVRDAVEGAKGNWDGHEPWGRRRLAYEIAHKGEAVYHLLLFTCPVETLDEITRVLKITDGVSATARTAASRGRPTRRRPLRRPRLRPPRPRPDPPMTATRQRSSLGRPVGEEREPWPQTSTASSSSGT